MSRDTLRVSLSETSAWFLFEIGSDTFFKPTDMFLLRGPADVWGYPVMKAALTWLNRFLRKTLNFIPTHGRALSAPLAWLRKARRSISAGRRLKIETIQED